MGHSGTRWQSHPTSVEIKAELVLGIHGRPYDSSGCSTGHVQTSWRKGSGGQGKSCGVRVSAGLSCFSHRTSRSGFGLRACFSGVCRLKRIPPATRRMSDPSWEALSTQGKAWVEGAYSSVVFRVYLISRSHQLAPFVRQTGERKAQTCAKAMLRQLPGWHGPSSSQQNLHPTRARDSRSQESLGSGAAYFALSSGSRPRYLSMGSMVGSPPSHAAYILPSSSVLPRERTIWRKRSPLARVMPP